MSTQNIRWRLAAEGGDKVVSEARKAEQAIVQGQGAVASATDKAIAASDRQIEKLKQVASQAAATTETQRRIEALAGGSTRFGLSDQASAPGNASARLSARTFEVEDRAYAQRAAELKAILDPLGAAQDRLNDELREYQALARAGKISTAELAQAQALARTRYDEAAAAIDRQGRGLTRLAVASRLNLARQGADVFVTAAMGMNPAMIAIQQGPQILDALATSGIKARGAMILLGGALAAVGVAAGTAVAAWSEGENAAGRLESAATGLGRASGITAAQLARLADENNEAGRVTVGTAEAMAASYVRLAGTTEAEIGRLISLTRGFAELTGVDAKDAVDAFTKAIGDPLKTATDLTRSSLGLFTQAELDNIEALQESGDLLAARAALLDGLKGAIDSHVKDVGAIESAWDAVGQGIKGAWEWLGRYLYRDESERLQSVIDRRASIERGQQANGRPLDARTQGLYDQLGREGQAILDARAARARQSERAGANQRAQLEEDRREAARRSERSRSTAGRTSGASTRDDGAARQREIDNALATLTRQEVEARRTRLQEWLQAGPSPETRATLERELYQLDVEARDAALKGLEDQLAKNGALDDEARAILERIRVANQETDAAKDATIATRERAEIEETRRATAARARDEEIARLNRAGRLASLRGDNAAAREADRNARILEEQRRILSDENFRGGDLAALALATARVGEELRAETTGAFREGLKGLVDDINSGGLRDALAEQLLNAGDRLLDKLLDGLSDIDFSGGSGSGPGSWINKGLNFLFGKNARGTNYWDGGLTLVGEEGPELADLPRGTRIRDAATSSRMLREAVQAPAAAPASLTYAPSYTNYGVDTQRLEAIMENDRKQFASKAVAAVRDAEQRRLGR